MEFAISSSYLKRRVALFAASALLLSSMLVQQLPLFSVLSAQAATTSPLIPSATGNYDDWNKSGISGSKTSYVTSDDGDGSFLWVSGNNNRMSFSFPGASVPSGSTINSVTVFVVAAQGDAGAGTPKFSILAEKGATASDRSVGSSINLTSGTYSTFSRVMTVNPFTSSAWTESEVNSWTVNFGFVKENATIKAARVTRIYLVVDYTEPVVIPAGCDALLNPGNSIQDAIDAASNGHVICLNPGSYPQTSTINVNKEVTITRTGCDADMIVARTYGDTATEAIVDGNDAVGNVFMISSNNVTLQCLEIREGTSDVVTSLNSGGPRTGIVIKNNIVHDAGDEGIQLKRTDGAIIQYNDVFNTTGDGINLSENTSNGQILSNRVHDIYSNDAAIYIYSGTNVTIDGNLIYDVHNNDGIKMGIKNTGADAAKDAGDITNNVIVNTAQDGIAVYMSNLTVSGNKIRSSSTANGGIYVPYGNSTNVDITDNLIISNSRGVKIGGSGTPTNVTVNDNCIENNSVAGLLFNGTTPALDATNNWWGDASGPFNAGSNPTGLGNSVADNVTFSPFNTTGCTLDPIVDSNPADGIPDSEDDPLDPNVSADTTPPAVPTHVSPADVSTLTTATLDKVDWSDVVDPSAPVTYFYEVSNSSSTNIDGSFVSPVYVSSELSASEIPTPGTPDGVYYWHVRAKDASDNYSAWSTAWSFTIANPYCGDGAIDVGGGEICDDGNTIDGDGCSAICEEEVGFSCTGEPSECAPLCDGQVATIFVKNGIIVSTNGSEDGQAYANLLTGTSGADVIVGTSGNDTIIGLGGSDLICAGDGDDDVNGRGNNDTIFGEGGNDILQGAANSDTLDGGDGYDFCDPGTNAGDSAVNCEADDLSKGLIVIEKDAQPDDEQDFTFSGDATFTLDDDGGLDSAYENSTYFMLDAGARTITEDHVSGWTLTGLSCVDPDSGTTTDLPSATVSLDVDASEVLSCSFVNDFTNVCGDGEVAGGEQCDDGDTDGGDGCSAICETEYGYNCIGEPSVCTLTELDAPELLGWNLEDWSTTFDESPIDVPCTDAGVFVNDNRNSLSQVWTSVPGTNVKYVRRVNNNVISGMVFTTTHMNGWFSFGPSEDGTYTTEVMAFEDLNSNNIVDSGERISPWSNACDITYTSETVAACNSTDDGLVAHWNFEEGTGTTAMDNTAYPNDGTLTNGALFSFNGDFPATDHINNYAMSVDGVDDHLDVADTTDISFDTTDPFSVTAWVNASSFNGYQTVLQKIDDSTSAQPGFVLTLSNGMPQLWMQADYSAGEYLWVQSTVTMGTGAWHHVGFSYDGSGDANGVKIFLDGVDTTGSIMHNNLTGSILNTDEIEIGNRKDGSFQALEARIDDVRIYNRTIDDTHAAALFSGYCDAGTVPPDADNDTIPDATDNCINDANPGQEDNETDGIGDVCDDDDDNDGHDDTVDNCPLDANADQQDLDNDGIGSVCDPVEFIPLSFSDSGADEENGSKLGKDTRTLFNALNRTFNNSNNGFAPGAFGGGGVNSNGTTNYSIGDPADLPPGAFGGDDYFDETQKEVICKAQKMITRSAGRLETIDYLAAIIRDMFSLDPTGEQMVRDALKNAAFCNGYNVAQQRLTKSGLAIADTVQIPLDSEGYPVSTNHFWNACIRNDLVTLQKRNNPDRDSRRDGGAMKTCADYISSTEVYYPDLNVYLKYERAENGKITRFTAPEGFILQEAPQFVESEHSNS